jgi:hypothetical protein
VPLQKLEAAYREHNAVHQGKIIALVFLAQSIWTFISLGTVTVLLEWPTSSPIPGGKRATIPSWGGTITILAYVLNGPLVVILFVGSLLFSGNLSPATIRLPPLHEAWLPHCVTICLVVGFIGG